MAGTILPPAQRQLLEDLVASLCINCSPDAPGTCVACRIRDQANWTLSSPMFGLQPTARNMTSSVAVTMPLGGQADGLVFLEALAGKPQEYSLTLSCSDRPDFTIHKLTDALGWTLAGRLIAQMTSGQEN